MILLLVTGIACLALCALQLTRPRRDAERDRRAALASVRSTAAAGPERRARRAAVGAARSRSRRCSSAFT